MVRLEWCVGRSAIVSRGVRHDRGVYLLIELIAPSSKL
jgi:hypothetical protein